jgi:hypothetical protein
MLKKLTMLAMSVAALVAFAVPATASAAEWTSEAAPLGGETTVKLSGHAKFEVFKAVGATGTVHAELKLKPGSTGEVTKFEVTNCVGIIGYAGNTCHASAQTLNWVTHCNADGTIMITGAHLTNVYTGSSPPGNSTLIGDVLATPDDNKAITNVSLSSANATANGLPAVISGSLNVEAPHSGKIGCV